MKTKYIVRARNEPTAETRQRIAAAHAAAIRNKLPVAANGQDKAEKERRVLERLPESARPRGREPKA